MPPDTPSHNGSCLTARLSHSLPFNGFNTVLPLALTFRLTLDIYLFVCIPVSQTWVSIRVHHSQTRTNKQDSTTVTDSDPRDQELGASGPQDLGTQAQQLETGLEHPSQPQLPSISLMVADRNVPKGYMEWKWYPSQTCRKLQYTNTQHAEILIWNMWYIEETRAIFMSSLHLHLSTSTGRFVHCAIIVRW